MPCPLVVLRLAACEAQVAGTTVAVHARPGGAVALEGRVIRPLRFGERWRLLGDAAATGNPIGATVLAHAGAPATETTADDAIAQVLALHLAGARPERTVPRFDEQLASLVAAGWTPRAVLDADADLIDLLTAEETDGRPDDGWTRIVLTTEEPAEPAPDSVGEVLRTLEQDLLGRLAPVESDEAPGPPTAQPDRGPASDRRARSATPPQRAPAAMTTGTAPSAESPAPAHLTVPAGVSDPHRAVPAETSRPHPVISAMTRAETSPAGLPGAKAASSPTADPVFPQPIRAAWPDRRPANRPSTTPPGLPAPAAATTEPISAWTETMSTRPARGVARATTAGSGSAPAVVQDDPGPHRAAPAAAPAPAGPDAFGLADQVAALLDDESDLRGLRR
jgi:hypothetical protein